MKFWLLCLFLLLGINAQAQTSQDIVGKHRVQYKQLEWRFFSSPNFDIYYYNTNEALAKNAAQHAELEFDEITDILGFSPYNKIQLYIYENKTDLRQSNVGLDEDNNILGGRTTFTKSIVEIPYPGNQVDFRYEIRYGIAKNLIYEMMYGGSFKETVQSSFLLTLPDWFLGGAALYAANGWDQDMDDYMRDLMLNENLRKPENMIGDDAVLAGQSIWAYIVQRYGRSNFSNILNLTRIMRNEQTSIGTTLGIGYDKLIRDWRTYYHTNSEQTLEANTPVKIEGRLKSRNPSDINYNNITLSKDGKLLAYSTNHLGRYAVFVKNLETGRTRRVMTKGFKVLAQRVDYNIPLLAWSGSHSLFIMHTKRGEPELVIYNYDNRNRDTRKVLNVSQINAMDVSENGKEILLSADRNGQTDLYLYYPSNYRTTQLTNDLADDLEPRFLPDNDEFVFSSNRKTDSSITQYEHKDINENFNIYKAPITLNYRNNTPLERLTSSPFSEKKPTVLDENRIAYLSNESGIDNIHILNLTTKADIPYTEFTQNVQQYDLHATTGTLVFTMRKDKKQIPFFLTGQDFKTSAKAIPTQRSQLLNPYILQKQGIVTAGPDSLSIANQKLFTDSLYAKRLDSLNNGRVNIRYYIFDFEKQTKQIVAPTTTASKDKGNPAGLKSPIDYKGLSGNVKYPLKGILGPTAYQNRLAFNSINTNVIIDPLQGMGSMLEANMSDMFENHKFVTSAIIFFDFRSSWYKFEYQYLMHRVDFKIRYSRRSYYNASNSLSERYLLGKLEATASYPLNIASAISFSPFYSRTRYIRIFEASQAGIAAPEIIHPYYGFRLEYNYDNTLAHGLNMVEGTRIKIKYESTNSSEDPKRDFNNFSIDIRKYQPIHKEFVLAVRGTYGQFTGPAAKKYMVGGMDNWAFNSSKATTSQDDPLSTNASRGEDGSTDRLFNQYATNLRGFDYNSLYGNSYIILNAELRLPIARYLYKGPIESNFLKNFQIVAFYDMGTAWSGNNPFNGDNSVNTRIIDKGDKIFKITVTNFNDPFLRSYGFGVRTMALGYYMKLDVAQGIQNGVTLSPRAYLTLGFDF